IRLPRLPPLVPSTTLFRSALALAGLALVVAAPVGWAHYPMLIASTPFAQPGDEVRIDFTIGHPYVNDRFAAEAPGRVSVLPPVRSEEHTSELQSRENLVCR